MTNQEAIELFRGIPRGLDALCVEDESMIANMVDYVLEEFLESHVEVAPNGLEALSLLEKRHFDLLIVDILMPGMNGKDLYREVKVRYPEVLPRFLFTTGDTVTQSTLAFVAATGLRLLAKPWGLPEFADVLREMFRKAPVADRLS